MVDAKRNRHALMTMFCDVTSHERWGVRKIRRKKIRDRNDPYLVVDQTQPSQ